MKIKTETIADVCDFIGGSQPPKSDFLYEPQNGYVRLIQTRDYKSDTFPTYIPLNSTRKFCDELDIMIGRYGPPIFQICRGLKGAYNVALIKAMPKPCIEREYLFYFLKQESVFQYVDKLSARTGGQTGVDLVSLNKYPITYPEHLSDQTKIVATLTALDTKIKINNRIKTELEAMAKTLYEHWFVQFDFPDLQGKPYKSSGGEMIFNAVLKRDVPRGWSDAIIGNVLAKTPASNKMASTTYALEGAIPVIDQSTDFICGYTNDISAKITPTDAHIVFGDHTRIVKLINFEYARGADGTQVLLSKIEELPNYLLYQMIAMTDLTNYGYARHFKFLKDSKIIIPNVATAHLYQSTVIPWFSKIRESIFENIELEKLRNWLLPMLMNGQVKVGETG